MRVCSYATCNSTATRREDGYWYCPRHARVARRLKQPQQREALRPRDRKAGTYIATQVCALADVTYRQLDYWDRTGLVSPSATPASGTGSQREYTRDDVVRVLTVRALLDAGHSLAAIRDNLEQVLTDGQLTLGLVTIRVDQAALDGLLRDREQALEVDSPALQVVPA